MTVVIVTGTSTGVGKTVTTAALAATATAGGLSVAVCKPAQTGVGVGEPGDLAHVQRLSGIEKTLELVRYADPLAPASAAARAGRPLLTLPDTVAAVASVAADLTLVEGAGGALVRLGEFTVVELAAALDAAVVVVAAAGLGTLNHSALTVGALTAAGVRCAGLVIGSWPATPDLVVTCNRVDLPDYTGVEVVGVMPEGVGDWDRASFSAAAPQWFRPEWVNQVVAGERPRQTRVR